MPAIPGYLTTAEAARQLGYTPIHVNYLARTGQLAGAVNVNGYLIPEVAVKARQANKPKPGRKRGVRK